VVSQLAVYHRVGVGAKLRLGVGSIAVYGLDQTHVPDLQKVLVRLLGGRGVAADDVVQDLAVHREDTFEGPLVASVAVSLDQAQNLFVVNPSGNRNRHRTPRRMYP
jgi:hypothetical protein